MKGTHFLVFFLLLSTAYRVQGQPARTTGNESQVWLGYANQTWITPKAGLWLDAGLRWSGIMDEWSTYLVRPGVSYRLSKNVTATAGYALFGQRLPNPERTRIRIEHRPWQQISWVQNAGRVQFTHRYRAEQRFIHRTNKGELAPGYRFNHRLRYQVNAAVSLRDSTRKALLLVVADEILVNAGKQVIYNYFDQNRVLVALGYELTKTLNVQVGYMYTFFQLPAGNQYLHSHVVRLSLLHNVKLSSLED